MFDEELGEMFAFFQALSIQNKSFTSLPFGQGGDDCLNVLVEAWIVVDEQVEII